MMDDATLNHLPGYDLYRDGVDSIRRGEHHSVSALLVSMATTRLTRAGLQIPRFPHSGSAHLELYALLSQQFPDAHFRYNANLQRLDKFCRAVERLNSDSIKSTIGER